MFVGLDYKSKIIKRALGYVTEKDGYDLLNVESIESFGVTGDTFNLITKSSNEYILTKEQYLAVIAKVLELGIVVKREC